MLKLALESSGCGLLVPGRPVLDIDKMSVEVHGFRRRGFCLWVLRNNDEGKNRDWVSIRWECWNSGVILSWRQPCSSGWPIGDRLFPPSKCNLAEHLVMYGAYNMTSPQSRSNQAAFPIITFTTGSTCTACTIASLFPTHRLHYTVELDSGSEARYVQTVRRQGFSTYRYLCSLADCSRPCDAMPGPGPSLNEEEVILVFLITCNGTFIAFLFSLQLMITPIIMISSWSRIHFFIAPIQSIH